MIHLAPHVYAFILLDRSHMTLCDKNSKLKSVTLTLDRLAVRECAFEGLTVLFDFWFTWSTSLGRFLFLPVTEPPKEGVRRLGSA
jgi:hypothetical protein